MKVMTAEFDSSEQYSDEVYLTLDLLDKLLNTSYGIEFKQELQSNEDLTKYYFEQCINNLKSHPHYNIEEIEGLMLEIITKIEQDIQTLNLTERITLLNSINYIILKINEKIAVQKTLQSTANSNWSILAFFKYIANIVENINEKKPSAEFDKNLSKLKKECVTIQRNEEQLNQATNAVKDYLIKEIDSYIEKHPEDSKNESNKKNQKITLMKTMKKYLEDYDNKNTNTSLQEIRNLTSSKGLWNKGFRSEVRKIKGELEQFIETQNKTSPKM